MDPETTSTKQPKSAKSGFFRSPLHLLVLVMVIASLFALTLVIYDRKNNPTDNQAANGTQARSGPSLSFSPAKQNVKAGESLTLSVWEDSGDTEVNAVQAKISFPTDKFEFVSTKAEASPFEIEAESSNNDGVVTIARGHVGTLTGRQLVATVELKAKDSAGTAEIKFVDGSHLLNATDNQDILKTKQEGAYTVEVSQ